MKNAIEYLYPGVDFTSACLLQDDGGGPYIASWHRAEPQPTQTEIDAAMLPAAKLNKVARINAEARARILAVYPIEKQSSANMGLYPQTYRDQMANDIAAVIQASNDACDLVDAAVDEAGIDAVVPNWPVIGG